MCEIEYAVDVKLAHDHSISFLSTEQVFFRWIPLMVLIILHCEYCSRNTHTRTKHLHTVFLSFYRVFLETLLDLQQHFG